MPIAELLLHVDDAPSWPARVAAALDLARRHDAHLVGVGVSAPVVMMGLEQVPTSLYAEAERIRREEQARGGERFREAMRHGGYEASSEWRSVDGSAAEVLATHSRYADLTVVSQGDPQLQTGRAVELPGEIALLGGRPVLAIPHVGARTPLGRRVLVAWNGAREAARAVGDAMVFLQEADEVHVLVISEDGMRETAGLDLARFLARHGVQAEVETVGSGGLGAGDLILNSAMERGSDLLVMGCYGHSRWREAVFGGASRALLRAMTVPTLLSH
jgi:nucleotide-binding universal stress UspA family protein